MADFIKLFFILYTCLTLCVFCVFAYDKIQARKNAWRVSETLLLILAAVAPFGALVAMYLLRHKTQKMKFWLVPVFAVLHLALLINSIGYS
jgi:uncharacterized membrane protein YsdA (DUF1294 family)